MSKITITDKDIATIEKLHDALLEIEAYGLNHPMMKASRDLTSRMYNALNTKE